MQYLQAVILTILLSASLWLWAIEGFVSAIIFFLFGLVIVGAMGFALQIGEAVGGFIDRFIRRHGRR
ncbi:MAG: hypothetical protein ABWU16_01475 [Halothiobacillaceae bacterium]